MKQTFLASLELLRKHVAAGGEYLENVEQKELGQSSYSESHSNCLSYQ